jgi:cytochrome c556
MSKSKVSALAMLALLGLAACGPRPETAPAKPEATILGLMKDAIDPNADAVWEAVGTVVSDKGTIERAPATDTEWVALQARAQALFDASQLLARTHAVGGAAHSPLADSDVAGTRTPEQIAADIKADPAKFAAAAGRLSAAARETLDGIKSRDKVRILKGGEEIDAACEACHAAYWYPRNPPIALPDYEAFGRQAVNR